MQIRGYYKRAVLLGILILLSGLCYSVFIRPDSIVSHAASAVKIKYNGKTYKNKSQKRTVKYNNKAVSKSSYKAILIKKTYMAPYNDIFKGTKASCSYKNKKITIKKNGVTIKMTLNRKSATVNGKKVKLPAAPLSVRYIKKKKTKILVPVYYVAKALHLSYKKSGTNILLGDTLHISYDGDDIYYSGVRGSIYYNHTNYNLSSLPVIKLDGSMYCPAEEVISNILKLKYEYNADSGMVTITNEDLNLVVSSQLDSDFLTINDKEVALSNPFRIIRNVDSGKDIVCIPAAAVLKQLDYTRSWNKTKLYYSIQSKAFFSWQKQLKAEELASTDINYLYSMVSDYTESSGTGAIHFNITGSSSEIMQTATVNRSGAVITVKIPKSQYVLEKNVFENFGEIIQKMEVTSSDDKTVTLSFTCLETADFSYVLQENTLQLNILYTYGEKDGSVTNYSLSIPKPGGVKFTDVTNEDLYASKKFKVILSGNHANFFQEHPVVINNNSVKGVTVEETESGTTEITVTTTSLRGYKIFDEGDNFVVSMGEPKKIYKSILVLDAGHGGHDPGAQNKGTNEKDLTLQIIYTLMKKYFSSNAPDLKIYWTRTNDTFVTLANRAAFAKTVGADAFISLHMNSASSSSANGTEVYYSVNNNSASFSGITSKTMANLFKTKLVSDLGMKSRGVKTAGYYVIKHNTVPAILIELGFISGSTDYSKLTNSAFQEKAAKSIYEQIVSMFDTYPTGR